MPKLIRGQPLIYERAEGVVYARYRDPPFNLLPRWVIGGEPGAIERSEGYLSYAEYKECVKLSKRVPVLKDQLEKLIITYDLTK